MGAADFPRFRQVYLEVPKIQLETFHARHHLKTEQLSSSKDLASDPGGQMLTL